ncbi:MAG: Flp pilus assembly protein CpaB [Acidimicrobiia bacterium]
MPVAAPERTTAAGVRDDGWGSTASTPGRRWVGRFSSGHLVMVAVGLLALVLSIAVLRDRPTGVRVAVADGEIRAGTTVHPGDFRMERVQSNDHVLATLVAAHDVAALRGRIAVATIADGELVPRSALRHRAAPDGLRAMSIPIDASLAVAGRLAPGDRVDILFAGTNEASVIVGDALVLAVDQKGHGGIGETSSPFTVTIAVDADASQRLAAAIADGDISIARTTGARPSGSLRPLSLERLDDDPTDS